MHALLPILLLLTLLLPSPTHSQTFFTQTSLLSSAPSDKYSGPCIADINADGYYDLLLSNHNQQATTVYFQDPDSNTFIKSTPLLSFPRVDVHGISAGDIDNDGILEVLVERGGGNGFNPSPPFMLRYGGGIGSAVTWEKVEDEVGVGEFGARGRGGRFVDLDGDGDLDLVLFNAPKVIEGEGERQIVYENVGGKFVRRSGTGLGEVDGDRVLVADFDGDGALDFIVGHKFGIVKNLGGWKFGMADGAVQGGEGWNVVMSIAEVDVDNDGDFDLYLARGFGQDDVLLENVGEGSYKVVSGDWGLPGGGHHEAVTAGDVNNDGFIDLVVYRRGKPRLDDYLLLNTGKGSFEVVTQHGANPPQSDGSGDGGEFFDYDLDGRVDLLTGSDTGAWRLYKNTYPVTSSSKYLLVRVGRSKGTKPGAAMGALVTVTIGKAKLMRRVGPQGATFHQSHLDIVHFGLGKASAVAKVVVKWTNGVTETETNLKPNQLIKMGIF